MPSQRLVVFKHLRTGIPFSWCTGQARLPHPCHSSPAQGKSSASGSSASGLVQLVLAACVICVSTRVRTAQSAAKKTDACSGSIAALKKLDISPAVLTLLCLFFRYLGQVIEVLRWNKRVSIFIPAAGGAGLVSGRE